MKIEVKPYRDAHEENVKELYRDAGVDGIAFHCAVSYCPVVVAYIFCKEEDPFNQEIIDRIEKVKLFYGFEEVIE